jgi:adenine-specific DNA-methyltransferase
MTEINFKGKEFVWNHHLAVPFRPLEPDHEKSVGPTRLDGNLIIHGDNLHALKALLPLYAGKVDCVYIDPPYNTGKSDWSYNDRVNSPMIQEWINSNPITFDDTLRHDKWACMMWPRLQLLRELMKPGAVIFASIDDNEVALFKQLLHATFGDNNNPQNNPHLGTIIWKNATDNNPTNIVVEHEYIHVFCNNKNEIEPIWRSPWSDLKDLLLSKEDELLRGENTDEELKIKYAEWFRQHKPQLGPLQEYNQIDRGGIFTASRSVHNPGKEGYRWEVLNPKTGKPVPQPLMGYRFPEETRDELLRQERIIFSEDPDQLIRLKIYLKDYSEKMPSLIEIDGRRGANELRKIFPERRQAFKNPKTHTLVEWLLSFVAGENAVVLDSFAGSGTTAHAVMKLNQRDHGNRRFILVECEEYAESLTAERVRRVSKGVPEAQEEEVRSGLGGSFTYCTLGAPVELDELLTGEELPSFEAIGAVLFHMATGSAFEPIHMDESRGYLGSSNDRHVWLLYKPDADWLRSTAGALTLSKAQEIQQSAADKPHLVFATARHVSQKLLAEQGLSVEFAPLPFALYRVERG